VQDSIWNIKPLVVTQICFRQMFWTRAQGILGTKRDETSEESRRFHNEEFRDSYRSSDIVRPMKQRLRFSGVTKSWFGKTFESSHFKDREED